MPGLKDGASYTYVCTKHVNGVIGGVIDRSFKAPPSFLFPGSRNVSPTRTTARSAPF